MPKRRVDVRGYERTKRGRRERVRPHRRDQDVRGDEAGWPAPTGRKRRIPGSMTIQDVVPSMYYARRVGESIRAVEPGSRVRYVPLESGWVEIWTDRRGR